MAFAPLSVVPGTFVTPPLSINLVGAQTVVAVGNSITSPSGPTGSPWYAPAGSFVPLVNSKIGTPLTVVNSGVPGDTSELIAARIVALVAANPTARRWIVECGANDLGVSRPYQLAVAAQAFIIATIVAGNSLNRIMWINTMVNTIPWPNPREYNVIMRHNALGALCVANGVTYVDVHAAATTYLAGLSATDTSSLTHLNDGVHWNIATGQPLAGVAAEARCVYV